MKCAECDRPAWRMIRTASFGSIPMCKRCAEVDAISTLAKNPLIPKPYDSTLDNEVEDALTGGGGDEV